MSLATSALMALAVQCAPSVAPETLRRLVSHESALNPYSVAVVGKALPRPPQSLDEAMAVASEAVKEGASISVGLGQINSQHFNAHDPKELARVFEPCQNLRLTEFFLQDCYARALDVDPDPQGALRKSLSCYYSGNFTRGFKPEPEFGGTNYVDRVLASTDLPAVPAPDDSISLPSAPMAPAAPPQQPTYERWDVLRQFPRFNSAPGPAAHAPTNTSITEETTNAQTTDGQRP
ncbi:Type IV secretion system protein virB1 [compost metagenome]